MVTNLFSSFDPSTCQNLALNWLSALVPLLLIPSTFWARPLRSGVAGMLTNYLNKELKSIIAPSLTPGFTILCNGLTNAT